MEVTEFITPGQAAALKQCSESSVRSAIRRGQLDKHLVLGRVVVLRSDVLKWEPGPYRGQRSEAPKKQRGPGRPRKEQPE